MEASGRGRCSASTKRAQAGAGWLPCRSRRIGAFAEEPPDPQEQLPSRPTSTPALPPPAAQERPAWASTKLSKYAARTAHFLHELTDVRGVVPREAAAAGSEHHVHFAGVETEVEVRVGTMPPSAVAHAQGLAFIFRRKAGALLSFMHERCLLIAKISHENGLVGWSAPLFCRGRAMSLGLTAGWLDIRVCWAMEREAGIEELLRPQHLAGVTASFLLDMNGARVRALRPTAGSEITASKHSGMIAKYYMLEAFMVDLSVRGGSFHVDTRLNHALYGPEASPEVVLQGLVPRPAEFKPVYDLLDALMLEARPATMRRVTSAPRVSSGIGLDRLGGTASRPSSAVGLDRLAAAQGLSSGSSPERLAGPAPRLSSGGLGRLAAAQGLSSGSSQDRLAGPAPWLSSGSSQERLAGPAPRLSLATA